MGLLEKLTYSLNDTVSVNPQQQNPQQYANDVSVENIPKEEPEYYSPLISYIKGLWLDAYKAKQPINAAMEEDFQLFDCKYSGVKLQQIRELGGSEYFMELIATKCNTVIALLTEIFLSLPKDFWSLEPSPVPELPQQLQAIIEQEVLNEVQQIVIPYAQLSGQDPNLLLQSLQSVIQKRINKKKYQKAKELTDLVKQKIYDQLVEGGWFEALKQCIFDFVVYRCAILKGILFKKTTKINRVFNPETQMFENVVEEKVIPAFERVSPFNFYPAPNAHNVKDFYVFELMYISPKKLEEFIGVEGFDEVAIRRILSLYSTSNISRWATAPETLEKPYDASLKEPEIEMLQFNGAILGKYLLQWGLSPEEVPDPEKYYEAQVWIIHNEIIKAILNPDILKDKPYTVASYVEFPHTIWGKGLPALLTNTQHFVNSISRMIQNNAAFTSAPLTEVNEDRVKNFTGKIYPFQVIPSTDIAMSGSPAVKFYNHQFIGNSLLQVLQFFVQLADQYSVPSYAHGDTHIGGAGRTASGLSMLMDKASIVLKKAYRNFDTLVKDSIKKMYYYNILFETNPNIIGDLEVVTEGFNAISKKEFVTTRRTEFLQLTNNPVDLQIIGLEGRRKLLADSAKDLEYSQFESILPEIDEIEKMKQELMSFQQQLMMPEQPTSNAPIEKKSNSPNAETPRLSNY